MLGSLDTSVATKLAKIAGLLGSDQDGERSAAAWHATKLLQAHGLSWLDVFTPALPPPQPPLHAPHVAAVQWALQFPDRLSPWERRFLADIGRRYRLSAKQAAALDGIVAKLRMGGCA